MPTSHQAYSIPTGTSGNHVYPGTFGLVSTVGSQNIQVTALGAFLNASAAWTASKAVALYRSDTQAVLAQVTINPGDSSATLVGQYLIKPITPITVPAGTPLVVGAWGYDFDQFFRDSGATITPDGGGGLISFSGGGVVASSAGAFPSSPAGEPNPYTYGGPTFVFQSVPTTTPALTVSPTTGSATDASTTVSITPTLANSSASLTATVSGGGTISTTTPTSGTAFTYTPPASGTGTATITVTDSTDSLAATCSVTYTGSNLAASAITVLSADSTGWTIQANSTGGTGGLTYQWKSCSTPDGSFANVAGATTQSYKFHVAAGAAPLYVQCVVTDSSATSVTSLGYPAGAAFSGSPALPYAVVPVADPYQFIFITDSTGTTAQRFDLGTFGSTLTSAFLPASVGVSDQAIQGTTAQGWDASLTASMIATLPAGKYVFLISLGVNDSKSAGANGGETNHLSVSAWSTHITSICNQLLTTSKLSGSKIILLQTGYVFGPTGFNEWDSTSLTLLLGYNNAIPSLCNGSTILNGSSGQRFYTFASQPGLFMDGVHESYPGGTVMAIQYAASVFAAISGGGGSTTTPASAYSLVLPPAPVVGQESSIGVLFNEPLTASTTVTLADTSATFPGGSTATVGVGSTFAAVNWTPGTTGAHSIGVSHAGQAGIADPTTGLAVTVSTSSFPSAGAIASAVAGVMATSPVGSVANLVGVAFPLGTVVGTPTPTTSTFSANGFTAPTGAYAGQSVTFQTGANAGQRRAILAYTLAGSVASFVLAPSPAYPLTSAPSTGDTFLVS